MPSTSAGSAASAALASAYVLFMRVKHPSAGVSLSTRAALSWIEMRPAHARLTMTTTVSALALAIGSAGCGVGQGNGAVTGALFISECEMVSSAVGSTSTGTYSFGAPGSPKPYNMQPTFFAGEEVDDFPSLMPNNSFAVRVQSNGSRIEQADVLYVNIGSVRDVALALNQALPVTTDSNVRATLDLNQTCPQPEVIPTLVGTMTFQEFGSASTHVPEDFRIEFGDRVRASFAFNVVDVRAATLGGEGSIPTDPQVGGQLTGYYDFIVRQGQAEQSFP